MRTNFVYILLILTLACCCAKEKESVITAKIINTTPYYVDIEKAFNHYSSIPLSTIADHIEYISLETSPECMLRKVDKIMLSDSFLFISDFEQIYKFGRKGNFINKIGHQGRGPGEYMNVLHFCIDTIQKKIYVHDLIPKFHVFDFNGNYISSFARIYPSFNFLCMDSTNIICSMPNGPQSVDPLEISVYIMNNHGEIVKTFKNYHKRKNNGFSIKQSPLYQYNNMVRFKEHCVDTLYTIEKSKLSPYAIFNLGEKALECDPLYNSEIDKEDINEKLRISELGETKDYILISTIKGLKWDPTTNFVFNKESELTTSLRDNKFVNDLGGLPFWPKLRFYHDDKVLIDYTYSYDFRDLIISNDDFKNGHLKDIADKLEENSNPVITIVYLK